MKINDKELEKINGGGCFSWGIFSAVVAGVTFIVGLISGYVNPVKCN